MKLIYDIIEILSDSDPNLENALVKAQVLAHKLGQSELTAWVRNELVGYGEDILVPDYRILPVTIYGNVASIARRYTHHRLPTIGVPDSLKEKILTRRMSGSIAVIQEFSKGKNITTPIAPEMTHLFRKGIDPVYAIESAWGEFGEGAFTQILVTVRSRMLDFMLKLSDAFPDETQPEKIKEISEKADVNTLFQQAVFGNGATLNVTLGNNNTTTQNTNNYVLKNDFESLKAVLKKHNVDDDDVGALEAALEADVDTVDKTKKDFGPRVKAWLGNMIVKSGSTALSLSAQTAASVLAAAIAQYYGFQ